MQKWGGGSWSLRAAKTKIPQAGWLIKTRNLFLPVLEAGGLRSSVRRLSV